MSYRGIHVAAGVFDFMQRTRNELMRLGSEQPHTKAGQQDIRLGQLLERMKDCGRDDFMAITVENTGEARS